ncbi:hypothetical protein M422DRAFT_43974 [Sphaerobolus stellatus SS14]|nr:hypothetical protein M422DRAFT_43974 [Sphaerobolus stellatus SS14]
MSDSSHSEASNVATTTGVFARPWGAVTRFFTPSSLRIRDLLFPTEDLPEPQLEVRQRSTRADRIPETGEDEEGQRPTVRDYHSINAPNVNVRVPKKIATPIRVEGKVWFANERTWISYLNVAILLGTFSLALFNSSKDAIARNFAYAYAAISAGIMIYGYVVYQKRITLIRQRYPGHFDEIVGPVVICVLLFIAILANFILRVREMQNRDPTPTAIPSTRI